MDTASQTRNMTVTRVINAPVEQVWRAWTEGERVKQWWGPRGFTAPLAEMDFREGGTSLVCMRAPQEYGGMDMFNTWTYEKIEPQRRIEFVQHFVDQDRARLTPAQLGLPPGVPAEVRHVLTFTPLEGGRTELTITEHGYTSAKAHDLSKAGMEQCIDKLVESLG